MSIERINPSNVYEPPGYTQVVKATGNVHVHVAGSIGRTIDRELVEGMRAQVKQTLDVLTKSLEVAGADVSDVVRMRVLTTDLDEYIAEAQDLTYDWRGEHGPAATRYEVSALSPGVKVEMEVTAILDDTE